MSLEKEKIVANTKKYFDTTIKLGIMNDELMSFLGEDFIKAPSSNMGNQYNCFEGGLVDYLLNVTKYAVLINNSLPLEEQVNQNSLIRVCLVHQIGKAKLYIENTSSNYSDGKLYNYNQKLVSMRISERSIFYLTSYGIKLTEEEYIIILNFDKVDDKMSEFYNSKMGYLLKMGSTLAIKK